MQQLSKDRESALRTAVGILCDQGFEGIIEAQIPAEQGEPDHISLCFARAERPFGEMSASHVLQMRTEMIVAGAETILMQTPPLIRAELHRRIIQCIEGIKLGD